jgi:hypothetical protein
VNRPRAADDFATIRARMEELRREREQASKSEAPVAETATGNGRGLLRRIEGRPRAEAESSPPRRYGSGR